MTSFNKHLTFRWADLDPNFHVRHSVYYDCAAQHRMEILDSLGLNLKVFQKMHFGPILFREECVFRKEIKQGDSVYIHTTIAKMRVDASRWSISHEFRTEDNLLCATLTVDGAWMDTKLRKLVDPVPEIAIQALMSIPKSEDFIES